MDPQLKEFMEQFTKLKVAIENKEYDHCSHLLPHFEKELSNFLKNQEPTDLDLAVDPYVGLEGYDQADDQAELNSDQGPFNLDKVPLQGNVKLSPNEFGSLSKEFPDTEDDIEPALLPTTDDGISEKLLQAEKLVTDASVLITNFSISGSIRLNKESVDHVECCQAEVSAAKKALTAAAFHFSQARLVNKDESLRQLL